MECRKYKNLILDKYYKDHCQILSKVIKEAKKMKYDNRVLNSSNRMKTSWNLINTEKGKGMNNQTIQSLNIGDEITTDHQTIADAFNKHFIMIPDTIIKNNIDKNYSAGSYKNNLPHSLVNASHSSFPSMKFTYTTEKEIDKIIKSLKHSNSCGYDEITTTIIQVCSPYITSPLNYICNRALLTGTFPDRLKFATARPLFMKGDKRNKLNYRPISLLPVF